MNRILLIFLIIFFNSCAKNKTVLICGDHVCVNKAEAEEYFETNLSIEVKIIDKKKDEEFNLVQLNLEKDLDQRKINIIAKKETESKLKILSKQEIDTIKKDIKRKKKNKNILKVKKEKSIIKDKVTKGTNISLNKEESILSNNNVNSSTKNVIDVCTIVKKCSIQEISKYLIKEGKSKSFPDITIRE